LVERAALPSFETTLRDGDGGCFSAFQAAALHLGRPISVLAVEMLVQCGQISHPDNLPAAHWFVNVNTPEDLERAEVLLENRNRVS
jgi:GTP:adenosylcobinamide-phosphate guanylyltransferase